MSRKIAPLLPATSQLLRQFGERLRLARLRRRLSAKQVAERAGMTPMTLRSLERGGSGVTIGAYLAVMQVLGIEKELEQLAQADPLGRALQDSRLTGAEHTPPQDAEASAQPAQAVARAVQSSRESRKVSDTAARAVKKSRAASVTEGKFVSSRDLAALLDDPTARSSRTKARAKTRSSKAKRR